MKIQITLDLDLEKEDDIVLATSLAMFAAASKQGNHKTRAENLYIQACTKMNAQELKGKEDTDNE